MTMTEETKNTVNDDWSWVDPDLVNLEPYECGHCGFHIGIDSNYLDQDSRVVVCPNCETEGTVSDEARAKNAESIGKVDMMVWCEACGPKIEITPDLSKPDTSIKTARLLLDQTVRMAIGDPPQIMAVPDLAETFCNKCGTRRTVTDKVAVDIVREMLGAKHTSDMFRKLQQLVTASATNNQV